MEIFDFAAVDQSAPSVEMRNVDQGSLASGGVRRQRDREHLTLTEVEALVEAAREGRYGLRDSTLLLMLFSHGREFIFTSERGTPLTARSVQLMIDRAAERAGLGHLNIHPHSLRHSCGYYLADRGKDLRLIQAYLGHKEVRHTTRYVALSPRQFDGLWDD